MRILPGGCNLQGTYWYIPTSFYCAKLNLLLYYNPMFALAFLLASAPPITQVGSTCPFGYYSQSGYCVRSSGMHGRTESINRVNTNCPFGTYAAGNYCTWTPRR